jgi:hypothetical protein
VAAILLISLSGCSVQSYFVRPADLEAAPTPALHGTTLAPVLLRRGTYRVTDEAPRPDGRVVVRGRGRHGPVWRTGLWLTLGGAVLFGAGLALSLAGMSNGAFGRCDITDGQQCDPDPKGAALFTAGIALSIVGDPAMLAAGPALMMRGARLAPAEVSESR